MRCSVYFDHYSLLSNDRGSTDGYLRDSNRSRHPVLSSTPANRSQSGVFKSKGGVMKITRLLGCLIVIFLSLGAARASVFGDVKGTVLDPQQRPIVGAKVTLSASSSAWSQIIQTKSVGDFAF